MTLNIETAQRPVPEEIEPQYRPYFEALAHEQVQVPRCSSCGKYEWPPRPMCGQCHGVEFVWEELTQEAEMFSFTTIERAFHPWFAQRVPYTVAIGDFGNGVRIMGLLNRVADGPSPACGQRLKPVFTAAGDLTVLEWKVTS